jgi:hypothetical protein
MKNTVDIGEFLEKKTGITGCKDCGAAHSGNITCHTCRKVWRAENLRRGWPVDFIDKLDAIGVEFVRPLGPESVREFFNRLEKMNA